jgi:hypothetical protein
LYILNLYLQSVWSSLIVVVSFLWGIVVFREPLDPALAAPGALCVVAGLIGMTRASSPAASPPLPHPPGGSPYEQSKLLGDPASAALDDVPHTPLRTAAPVCNDANGEPLTIEIPLPFRRRGPLRVSRRTAGLLCACFNGVYGGSVMMPLKYATLDGVAGGIDFAISFACGAALANALLWALYIAGKFTLFQFEGGAPAAAINNSEDEEGPRRAVGFWARIPSLQLRTMFVPGLISGLLWSTGNMASIYAVLGLGQAIGYSCSQGAILVAGLFGIFYYREIRGVAIAHWLIWAAVTVGGIVMLAFAQQRGREKHAADP